MRSSSSARRAGARFESTVAYYLRRIIGDDRIERRVKNGKKDRGDITGVRFRGRRVVIECKDCARLTLAEWVKEAATEAGNDDAGFYMVVHKRKGVADPGEQYVTLPLKVMAAMLALDPGVLESEAGRAFTEMMGDPMGALREMGDIHEH